MFNKVTIIGVGLIGGSLARDLKVRGLAKHITGCSRSAIKKARDMGIIDEAVVDPANAVADADLVILCTPLSTYGEITAKLSPALKDGAILSDAGSVKGYPTQQVLENLEDAQKPWFVPGHPIAGTENSGPEASLEGLFEDKKTILIPHADCNPEALKTVQKLWESVGANVEIMDALEHDKVYAHISHSIQYISSCYALALADNTFGWNNADEIKESADINFRKFIRLAGSDPTMWRDIFLANKDNLLWSVNKFISNFSNIRSLVTSDGKDELQALLQDARDKRLKFHDVYKGNHSGEFRRSDYDKLNVMPYVAMEILQRIVGAAVMAGTDEQEYGYAVGAGFHGITKNVILENGTEIDDIFARKEEVLLVLDSFATQIDKMKALVEQQSSEALRASLLAAQNYYKKVVG